MLRGTFGQPRKTPSIDCTGIKLSFLFLDKVAKSTQTPPDCQGYSQNFENRNLIHPLTPVPVFESRSGPTGNARRSSVRLRKPGSTHEMEYSTSLTRLPELLPCYIINVQRSDIYDKIIFCRLHERKNFWSRKVIRLSASSVKMEVS